MEIEPSLASGVYEQLVTERLRAVLGQLPDHLVAEIEDVPAADAPLLLSRHVARVLGEVLKGLGPGANEDAARVALLGEVCCRLLDTLNEAVDAPHAREGERLATPAQLLRAVRGSAEVAVARPLIPLGQSDLLVNEPGERSLRECLRRELESADRVDLLCAFINWNGTRLLREALEAMVGRGGRLRVVTSTYLGVTERRAIDELCRLGAEVRVAYDREPARTRLHAKAWLLHRNSGFSTAFIGSSNLSHSALTDGLEWNVRLSDVDAPGLLRSFRTTFDRYWSDPVFEPYDPERDGARLDAARRRTDAVRDEPLAGHFFDLRPFPHQREILERLDVERQVFHRWHNLVVAATGTGKTLVAAFDYQRLSRREGQPLKLLFIAHREEILRQARHQFRNVLRDGDFGELWVGGARPKVGRHVFASIQSLSGANLRGVAPDHYQMVVLDEMHHAPARSYEAALQYLRPRVLLGLTATPERADGLDTRTHFAGAIAAELRLWDALEQQLLVPFHYFGVPDDLDLSGLRWQRGAYVAAELESAYLGKQGRNRVGKVIAALERYLAEPQGMRALGFCVGVAHADFMARCFNEAGIPSRAVTGMSPEGERKAAVSDLRDGSLRALFTVDLFNEGVDIPEVDTLLLLRPTESATLFMQQLGRGLRLCEGKACVTVLDFIGQQHARFRFDLRYRALTGYTPRQLETAVEQGFSTLPPGCDIRLERTARDAILSNLRQCIANSQTARLTGELCQLGNVTLQEFIEQTGIELEDLYRGGRTLTALRRRAGQLPPAEPSGEAATGRGLERLLGQDDPEWFEHCRARLGESHPPSTRFLPERELRWLRMLTSTVVEPALANQPDPFVAIQRLWELDALREELADLLELLRRRTREVTTPLEGPQFAEVPLRTHGSYSQRAIATAFGMPRPDSLREGVRWFPDHATDALFITFRKAENEYSPSTRYDDYVISPAELHWESQSVTTADSNTGRRYRSQQCEGRRSHVLIFAREQKTRDGRTLPYLSLGPARYLSHESERPMRIRWELLQPMPEHMFERFRAASG